MHRPSRWWSNGNQNSWSRLPLVGAKKACRDRQASSVTAQFSGSQSGRWDSNPRRPAWEAARKQRLRCITRQESTVSVQPTSVRAKCLAHIRAPTVTNGDQIEEQCSPANFCTARREIEKSPARRRPTLRRNRPEVGSATLFTCFAWSRRPQNRQQWPFPGARLPIPIN